jgi:4-hydroxymandelate oxidase
MRVAQPSRRQLLGGVGAFAAQAAAPLRLVPRADLVNVLEYEAQAKRKLAAPAYALIAGGDRAPFDRITLHPRLCVPVLDMDLSVTLFGETHFTPIVVGPVSEQKRFHPDGELATVKGASTGKAGVVISSRSSVPLATLMAEAKSPVWYQVFANDPAVRTQTLDAVQAGCKVICATVAAPPDWAAFAALKRSLTVPVIAKGVATPAAARLAIQNGADGIVVSTYGGTNRSPILGLAGIVDAVAGKVPVLVDGCFRRGTDVIKALAFGAQGVLVGRPVMWGLAAYGAEGVQGVVEMLQTELARYMGQCGRSNLKALDRTVVRVHGVRS